MLKTAAPAPPPPPPTLSQRNATTTVAPQLTTTAIKPQPQQQYTETTSIKMERRESTTSESSLEHLDLGHTPKKLNTHSSATSTPNVVGASGKGSIISNNNNNSSTTPLNACNVTEAQHVTQPPRRHSARQQPEQPMLPHDSDETNDYDDDESADEKRHHSNAHNLTRPLHRHHHHKRRSSGRLDKRSVQLVDYNSENPNSLRKKFRFNRSTAVAEVTNNESGFVDGSSSSQLLNSSTISTITSAAVAQSSHLSQQHHSPPANSATGGSQSSSASSSPHGGTGASASASASSSPESGIGERDDMKFVCPICEVVSATPHEFTNHIRCHNYSSGDTENFSCRICSKVLSSASSLDRHVLVHTGERPFNCKYCHLTFTTNGNMHRHMRTHKQHQHNHHHRRNSNGTVAKQSSGGSNNHNTTAVAGTTHLTPVTSANAATSASVNTQLTNGSEGVKAAAASPTTTATNLSMAPTTIVTAVAAANGTGANVRRLNGNNNNSNNNGVESYESDGGCSTDSSSAISQQSSNNHNHNNNNNNNTNSNNNNNNIKAHNNNNNFKRKNSDNLDEEITLMKRRVKTTINNNTIIDVGDENQRRQFDVVSASATAGAADDHTHLQQQQQHHLFVCPVCSASEFDSMLSLSAHIDSEHCDIPAKCRHCDVVFHTHRQLNLHPCTGKFKLTSGFKDLTFTDFSSEKFPLIAKSLCEQNLRAAAVSQRFECARCNRAFSSASAMEMHARDCEQSLRLYSSHTDLNITSNHLKRTTKVRSVSESSAGIDDDDDDDAEAENEAEDEEQNRREQFFKHLYLKNRSDHHQSLCESPQHSTDGDEQLDREIKCETDCEKLAQQSHDSSKDLADIQSILNMTSSSSTSNFLKNFEQTVNTPSSNYGLDKDEEEAQDAFTSEFRKMKLRGEFPCKLCTAVFPNLRALKGHNRIHLSAAGPSGPFRCNMCPYSICDKAALVRHMRTHNGDRPYECAVCNYAFTTKANCERHLRNRHAKTTRDEVKRAIIYHPSEDSSCDDPTKKLHLFSSPEFDDDVDMHYQHHHPKDRSTPVSHLKEMLTSDIGDPSSKAMKIQVKSLEQLLDKTTASSSYNETYEERQMQTNHHLSESSPIDLSMDVLDLSKKPSKPVSVSEEPIRCVSSASTVMSEPQTLPLQSLEGAENSKFDLSVLEKNQQYLMAQQQLINDALPKIVDPAHYFQQLYRNLVFPPINPLNPFFLQNSFLPNNLGDLQKYAPLMSRMFGSPPVVPTPQDTSKTNTNAPSNQTSTLLPQISPLMSDKSSISSLSSASPVNANQILSKSLASPSSATLNIPRHPHIPQTVLPGGPVKMVIKNGVLMPKQKQRRYRTERPFACEHCSARFTLRSNMERHVKQQHPQFYAQRQRSGHHIMRGRGASSAVAMNNISHLQAAIAAHNGGANVGPASISEQVKYAILAQQLKARKDTDLLQQALAHGSSSVAPSHLLLGSTGSLTQVSHDHQLNLSHLGHSNANGSMEDDDPKLVIDEDDDIEEIPDDENDEDQFQDQEDELNESFYDEEPQLSNVQASTIKVETTKEANESAKKVAETILEQAIKASGTTSSKPEATAPAATTMKSMIAQAESVGKFLKEVASSSFKDESQDLVPVSKLVDNATTNSMSFNNYFRPSDVANHMEQSDEEGLVASGSASESNNSGTEDISTSAEPKKKSAYSLAPNRVSCPYCQRMFPWSSSLRRHILTHTGQKPFKCSHCPLLFTTKSNCDRHLLRKHGNVESAVSVYVPTEDVNEPIPVPKSVEEIELQQRQREEEERKRKALEAAHLEKERREKEQRQQHEIEQQQLLKQLAAAAQFSQLSQTQTTAQANSPKIDINSVQSSSELPFKCHLCDCSFGERFQCLDHIKIQHTHDFALLLAKGAIDTDPEPNQVPCTEDEEKRPGDESNNGRIGKYPDYSNRKVICAFCVRRFWSTEDLRRHMRTHSGERPFQCDICLRKFTLKHSMLRHMKKHNGRHHSGLSSSDLSNAANSGSDLSDDEREMPMPSTNSLVTANSLAMPTQKIQELLTKANEWRQNRMTMAEQKENIAEEQHNNQTDLIGNLLGISDQGILNKLLSSADEAAKFLGVDK